MDIKKALTEITDSINNGKLVVFVGAGVSKNYGYPDWNKLTNKILKEIKLEKHKNIKDTYLDSCTKPISSDNIITINKTISKLGYATDEYLLFAQYLYEYFVKDYKDKGIKQFVKRGKKKFEDTIKKIIEDNTKKEENYEIIPKIFDLHPQHIITTNFDTLLEDSDNGNYKLIVKNTDLANSKVNNYIIKMHGDFENKNIVLKESDYHYYRDNFKLIDNFVRSVFATHTILFLGFSANDPNFKQIYAWISKVLGKETRNAYFLSLNKKSNDIYRERYLDNKYIKIINYEDLLVHHHDKSSTDDYGKRLEYCLEHLNISFIESFREKLDVLKWSQNPEIWGAKEFLQEQGIKFDYDKIIVNNPKLELHISNIKKQTTPSLKLLFSIFLKLTYDNFNIKLPEEEIKIIDFVTSKSNAKLSREIRYLTNFEFLKLESLLNKYPKSISLRNHIRLQRKAFLLFMMGNFDQAYNVLYDLMTFYKNHKLYFEYIKTGINRNYVYDHLNPIETYFDFKQEMILLSTNERNKIGFFLNYLNDRVFHNELMRKASTILDETLDLEIFFSNGGMEHSFKISNLLNSMDYLFNVLYEEGICSNYNEIFRYYLKSYFISYYTESRIDTFDENLTSFFGGISTVTNLKFNYLYYAIQFLSPLDWDNILKYSDKKIEIDKKVMNEIVTLLKNFSSHFFQKDNWNRRSTNYFIERLVNFLILFTNTELEFNEFSKIINYISPVIFEFDIYSYSEYLKIFCEKHQKHFISENGEKLKPFFTNIIKSMKDEIRLNPLSDFRSILSTFENVNFKKKFPINYKGINNINNLIENERTIFNKCIGINILISIYYNCSKNMKIKLYAIMQNFFEDNSKNEQVIVNFYLCLNKAIKRSIFRKTEESKFISNMLKQPLSEKDKHFSVYLDIVYQLKKEEKVTQKEISKYLSKFANTNMFYRAFLLEENFIIPETELKARWFLHLLDNHEKLFYFIKKFSLDYKELIILINTEILLKENYRNKEKYIKLLEFLLDHINA